MSLRARLEALEGRFRSHQPIFLTMPDTSQRSLAPAHGENILDYALRLVRNPEGEEAAAIRESVAIHESRGRMIEITRAILMSPGILTNDPEDSEFDSETGEN
jgi:hypothetical protein